MTKQPPAIVVLAAGLSTRYGGLKQLDPIGPQGEAIMDYNVYDALRAGFSRAVFVVRPEIEERVRAHVTHVMGPDFPASFVNQTLDALPDRFRAPPDRLAPWGTSQAVLCAAALTEGPFGVCNADDLYGPQSFSLLFSELAGSERAAEGALVGYRLIDTLTGSRGVARGICVLGRDGFLEGVSEVRNVRLVDGFISGKEESGDAVELTGEEIASMNLWGFAPPLMRTLERQFSRFLGRWGADPDAELPLSTAVNGQLKTGYTRIAVVRSPDNWFGVTHAADRESARIALEVRIRRGEYPDALPAAFRAMASGAPQARRGDTQK